MNNRKRKDKKHNFIISTAVCSPFVNSTIEEVTLKIVQILKKGLLNPTLIHLVWYLAKAQETILRNLIELKVIF